MSFLVRIIFPLLVFSFAQPVRAVESQQRPDIIFILVDDLRWDELGCMGHPFAKTPNIDRIANEGMRFRNAFTSAPLSSSVGVSKVLSRLRSNEVTWVCRPMAKPMPR